MSVHSSDDSTRRMKKTASESDLRHLTSVKPPTSKFLSGLVVEDVEEGIGFRILGSSSYDVDLGFDWSLQDDTEVSGSGGGMFHGAGVRSEGGDGDDNTDVHYRKMTDAHPGNGIYASLPHVV